MENVDLSDQHEDLCSVQALYNESMQQIDSIY